MSSKRKNTPIKYSTTDDEELFAQKEHLTVDDNMETNDAASPRHFNTTRHDESRHYYGSDHDQARHSSGADSDAHSDGSLSPAREETTSTRDSESPGSGSDSGRPRSKKQRLLQSVRDDQMLSQQQQHHNNSYMQSHATTLNQQQQQHYNLTNNNLKTTTTMTATPGGQTTNHASGDEIDSAPVGVTSPDVIKGMGSLFESTESVNDKQKKLNAMIQHLQSLQQTLALESHNKVSNCHVIIGGGREL